MSNVILVGVMVGIGLIPLDKKVIEQVLRERFPRAEAFGSNMKAFDKGVELAENIHKN